jgi:hypothetical protein
MPSNDNAVCVPNDDGLREAQARAVDPEATSVTAMADWPPLGTSGRVSRCRLEPSSQRDCVDGYSASLYIGGLRHEINRTRAAFIF